MAAKDNPQKDVQGKGKRGKGPEKNTQPLQQTQRPTGKTDSVKCGKSKEIINL
jgi:hypothetical protein